MNLSRNKIAAENVALLSEDVLLEFIIKSKQSLILSLIILSLRFLSLFLRLLLILSGLLFIASLLLSRNAFIRLVRRLGSFVIVYAMLLDSLVCVNNV
jgi:hypothetical protein